MLMAEDGRQQLSWFHFLVWQMAETCLTPPYGHPHCCRVSSAKTYCPKKRCSATCTVQRCVSCPPPALWHTPLCCPTTASVTPYCGDQKDLSQSRQIELWLCAGASYAAKWRVIDLRLQVQNPNAPSEPCLYRGPLDAFEELDIIHGYRQISYKPAESFLLECLLLFSLLRLWRAALQMGLIESRAAFKALLIKRQSLHAMMAVPSLQWRSFASVQIISRWIIKLFHELEYWVLFLNIISGGSKASIDVYEVFCCGEMILIKFVSRPPARL